MTIGGRPDVWGTVEWRAVTQVISRRSASHWWQAARSEHGRRGSPARRDCDEAFAREGISEARAVCEHIEVGPSKASGSPVARGQASDHRHRRGYPRGVLTNRAGRCACRSASADVAVECAGTMPVFIAGAVWLAQTSGALVCDTCDRASRPHVFHSMTSSRTRSPGSVSARRFFRCSRRSARVDGVRYLQCARPRSATASRDRDRMAPAPAAHKWCAQ
jgi:hypothetical protein